MTDYGNGRTVPSWEQKLDALEDKLTELADQRDSAVRLLEHCQRELQNALSQIEILENAEDREAEETEARDG